MRNANPCPRVLVSFSINAKAVKQCSAPKRSGGHRRSIFDVKLLNAMYVGCGSRKCHILSKLSEREDLQWRHRRIATASRILKTGVMDLVFAVNLSVQTGQD